MKNFILNGAMAVDQNLEGGLYYSDPNSEVYSLDQWRYCGGTSGVGRFTIQRRDINFKGFTHCLQAASTVQQCVLNDTDNMHIEYPLEGNRIAPWGFGTADAKNITVSFWIDATVAGDYSFTLMNGDNTRSYVTTFNIPVAAAWTYITLTIPADTGGVWSTAECTFGAKFIWSLGVGATATTPNINTWQSAAYWNAPNTVQMMEYVANSSVYITGFQVELGDSATDFEFRGITEELLDLQRYYYKTFPHGIPVGNGKGFNGALTYRSQNSGTTASGAQLQQPVAMCAPNAPVTFFNPVSNNSNWYNQSYAADSGTPAVLNQSEQGLYVINTQASIDGIGNTLSVHAVINSRLGGS